MRHVGSRRIFPLRKVRHTSRERGISMAVRTIDREAVRAWRPRSGGRLVAPDGSTLTVRHATSGLAEPWFTENRVRFSGTPEAGSVGGRAFETGPVGTVDG